MSGPVGVGIVGAGVISNQYLENLTAFADVDVRFVADRHADRAAAQASRHGVDASGSLPELLDRDDVELVVNLTPPAAHAEIGEAVLDSGRHLWSEKPLSATFERGRALLDLACELGLQVGCAPDTVLGAGFQSGLRAVTSGVVGRPVTAVAEFRNPGPDMWHPNPAFLFARGAGPLMDIGPYYLTALIHLLGSVSRVMAISTMARPRRTVATGPREGDSFAVEVPTHVATLLEFETGSRAEASFSFQDHHALPSRLDVVGTLGTISLPSPLAFLGESVIWDAAGEVTVVPGTGSIATRGTGVVDLARAVRAGARPRCSGSLGLHVLEVMEAIADSAEEGMPMEVQTSVAPVAPLPADWSPTDATL